VLFQEEDPEAVMARLLNLATTMVQATAGALYVLREVGNPASGLRAGAGARHPGQSAQHVPRSTVVSGPKFCSSAPTHLATPRRRRRDGDAGTGVRAADPAQHRRVAAALPRRRGRVCACCSTGDRCGECTRPPRPRAEPRPAGRCAAAPSAARSADRQQPLDRERELQIAETIQKRLLPTPAPATEEYEFAWCSIAAKNIGGDYLDLLTSDLGDIYAVVADASGHGINSALLMSSFRSNYRGDAPWMEPNDLASSLNARS
jgi:hypothetical protein